MASAAYAQPFVWTLQPTKGGVLLGNYGDPITWTTAGTTGQLLVSTGSGSNPSFQSVLQHGVLTADSATSVNDSLYTTPLSFTAAASKSYSFHAVLYLSNDSTTGDKVAVKVPSGATFNMHVTANTTDINSFTTQSLIKTDSAGAAVCSFTGAGLVTIDGYLVNSTTAGAVTLEFEKVTNGKATLKKYSYVNAVLEQ
ncbi:MAG: hypothetical protein KGH93_03325 [Patescibacteria group bacterium]|nr:hypothetical protein [Patescibacteria group bacterium]